MDKAADLKNRVALVTGSSRGIGLATARALAQKGARVMLNGRSPEPLEQARRLLQTEGLEVKAVAGDVSLPEDAKALVENTQEAFGRLDILINNAGLSMRSNLEEMDPASSQKMVDVNLMGCIYPTLFSLDQLKKNSGTVVFISSIAGLVGLPTGSLYSATKMALRGLADSLRCELSPHGVHVGVVYVGFTENDPVKKVLGGGGNPIAPERPGHMSQAAVAQKILGLVQKRERQTVLTPIGKLAQMAAWLSPVAVENAILFTRKHDLGEHLGIR